MSVGRPASQVLTFICKMMFVWNIFMVERLFKKKVPVRSKPDLKRCLFVRCKCNWIPVSR